MSSANVFGLSLFYLAIHTKAGVEEAGVVHNNMELCGRKCCKWCISVFLL